MDYIKVDGYDNLVRDCNTNAIINTNKSDYEQYVKLKNQKIKSDLKIDAIEYELNNLKTDISEIKQILKKYLNEHE